MNQYESGKHSPDFSILHKIAKVLDVPAAYFYADEENLSEILKIYGQLKTADRKALLAFSKEQIKR